jgi:hypothetical protein
MDNIVLYCKSFDRDLNRIKVLFESINKYNMDNIPFYVSVPRKDLNLFKNTLGSDVNLIIDEEIYSGSSPGWIQQQIVKSNFWKLNIAENYLCLDSDSYFIKNFNINDFIYQDNIPYTVIHEQKELFTWTVNKSHILGFDPKISYTDDREKIMSLFGRTGKYYDLGPPPVIWSAKVWKDLDINYVQPNNLTFEQLLAFSPSEFSWYGESLLAFKSIPIYPIEPLFKFFHFSAQLEEYKKNQITENMISQNYFGIVLQSNWDAPIKY